MGELWAHSLNGYGSRHRLADHLRGTAALARSFGDAFGAGDLAGYLGLTHDAGKGECAWQRGLLAVEKTRRAVGTDHKGCGTWLAQRAVGPFAMCISGHHAGLPTLEDIKSRLLGAVPGLKREWEAAAASVTCLVPEIANVAPGIVPPWYDAATAGDPLAVEAHFSGAPRSASAVPIGSLADRYETRRAKLLSDRTPSPADRRRDGVYEEAAAKASGPRGMYRLAAPTGSGKTITAGGFAVRHAQVHGLRRVVLAVPFISITEQNAAEYRHLLDEPEARWSRSTIAAPTSTVRTPPHRGGGSWRRKTWDAPFVVTTTVQLFQSLFDHRPAAMRKLHRLASL